MDSIPSFVVVTDAYGNIIYLNKSYAKFLEVNREAQIGKHITEVIDNTKMHIVAKTGKPEINVIGKLKQIFYSEKNNMQLKQGVITP